MKTSVITFSRNDGYKEKERFAIHLQTLLDTFDEVNYVEYNKTKSTVYSSLEEKLIITLGSKGARFKNKIYPVKQVDVRDTSGAGDTFLAGLVHSYVLNKDIELAINFANKCASQVVQKKGTAKVNINEL